MSHEPNVTGKYILLPDHTRPRGAGSDDLGRVDGNR